MTQNEAKEYINNPNNWHVVQTGEYARVSRLDYGDCHFACVSKKEIINTVETFKGLPAKTGFKTYNYYGFDVDNDCFGYTASQTEMMRAVWKESKK